MQTESSPAFASRLERAFGALIPSNTSSSTTWVLQHQPSAFQPGKGVEEYNYSSDDEEGAAGQQIMYAVRQSGTIYTRVRCCAVF